MTQSCWDELGIEESTDARAIRKAYARRLKAIDADNDAPAFIRLREALEDALGWAAWTLEEEEWERSQGEQPPHAHGNDADPPLPPPPADDLQPWTDWSAPAPIGHAAPLFEAPAAPAASPPAEFLALQELDALLFPADAAEPPDPADLVARTRRILEDPAMERIDHAERVQDWLARLIVDSEPLSDPVADVAIAHFGWERDEGRWDAHWDVARILDRRRALRVVARVSDPKHQYHRAWRELTSDRLKLPVNYPFIRSEVRDFLYGVRERTPLVEDFLNPNQVRLWDEHFGDPNRGRSWSRIGLVFALLWCGLQLIRLFAG